METFLRETIKTNVTKSGKSKKGEISSDVSVRYELGTVIARVRGGEMISKLSSIQNFLILI